MPWHQIPKGDEWKRVTLMSVHALSQRVWLRCNVCGHEVLADALEFATGKQVDPGTPLLLISRRLVCTACGERKAHCWPEPYAITPRGGGSPSR